MFKKKPFSFQKLIFRSPLIILGSLFIIATATTGYLLHQNRIFQNIIRSEAASVQDFSSQLAALKTEFSADLNNTNCADNCPVLSLADYAARSGAFAGVNGSYFCPATYPQCASKKNSFDTLLMNKNKRYFNSENNIYSVVPTAIFTGNSARFVAKSLEWGRDTSVDAVIADHPLLVLNSEIVFSGDGDPKHTNKGNRSFIANAGNMVYIGVVRSATVVESAKVMKVLGMNHALNLDDGGSTALWSGGYKVGPGRQIPNAVLLVKK